MNVRGRYLFDEESFDLRCKARAPLAYKMDLTIQGLKVEIGHVNRELWVQQSTETVPVDNHFFRSSESSLVKYAATASGVCVAVS